MNPPKNYFHPNALMPLLTSRLLVLANSKKGCHFFGVQQVRFEFTEVPCKESILCEVLSSVNLLPGLSKARSRQLSKAKKIALPDVGGATQRKKRKTLGEHQQPSTFKPSRGLLDQDAPKEELGDFESKLVAGVAEVFRFCMHKVAVCAFERVTVVRGFMRIGGFDILRFFDELSDVVTTRAGFHRRRLRVLHVRAVATLAVHAELHVLLSELFASLRNRGTKAQSCDEERRKERGLHCFFSGV